MNLVWLKYVSYVCVAGAVFLYGALRLNRLAISRPIMLALFAACIVLASGTWHLQEVNSQEHSPRQLVIGTVASVSVSTHKHGRIDDTFQLRVDGGSLSPKFSTDDVVAESSSQQPIHEGDTLGVLYRTWDNMPVTIDELQGQSTGWHYHRYRPLDPYVWAVGGAGFFAFIGAFASSRRRSARADIPVTTLDRS